MLCICTIAAFLRCTSEDVIPTVRSFLMSGVTDPDTIWQRLHQRGWEAASVWGVIREVERTTGRAVTR